MYGPGIMKTHLCFGLLNLALLGFSTGKTIPNHAVADLVLGQADFTTAAFPSLRTSRSLNQPNSVVVDPVSRKVFVADSGSNRVLRYPNVASLTNGAGAEAVFGQTKFSSFATANGDQGMSIVRGMFLDRLGRLWVADRGNNRVLMFEAAIYRESNAAADRVFGQPDFNTTTPGVTASKFDLPQGVWVDTEDRLWVADFANNRVLRFDSISTKSNGASADGVLGQANFTTSASGGGASAIDSPFGISISSAGTLFVASAFGNRVLRFNNAASLGNGAGATAVLGQADFASTTAGLSATQFSRPGGVTITPDDTLWVCDENNRRVLRFDKASTLANGSAANGIVGQADFTSDGLATTNRGIGKPFLQPFVDASANLWIPDRDNNRILRFPPDVTAPLLTVTPAVPKKVTKKNITIKGTASDAFGISKVQYRVGNGSLKTATGTTSWSFTTSLATGKNKITIFATDSVGNKSLNKEVKVKRVAKSSPASVLVSGK